MSRSLRLPAAVGGLGAAIVLGLGASYAIGGASDKTDQLRHQLHGGKAKNVILLLGDGMGVSGGHRRPLLPVRRRRPMNMDRLPFTGFQTTWSVKPAAARPTSPTTRPTRPRPARCGRRARRRSTSASRRARAARRTSRARTSRRCSRSPRGRQADRQRLDRRDHRRDAGRAELAHLPARLPGPERHADACPTETKAAGGLGSIAEQTVDHKVDVVLGGGAQPLRPAARGGRDDRDRGRLRRGQGLPVRRPTPPACSRAPTRQARARACSPPAT